MLDGHKFRCHFCAVFALIIGVLVPCGFSQAVDLDGKRVDPVGGKIAALIFVGNDCPISSRYAPEIQRLSTEFAARGVRFWLVYPDKSETVESIRRYVSEHRYDIGVVRDPEHALMKRAEAHVTPEAALFAGGKLVYHGRIDNLFENFGRSRSEATQHDLETAIESVLDGKPVAEASAPAVGCYISDLK